MIGDTLPPSLALLLRKYREERIELFGRLGKQLADDDFVFCRLDRSPLNPNAVTVAFSKIVRRMSIPRVRLHDLRHTHATLMLKAGIHPKIVSERLGHANVGITLDIYSHVLPGLQEAAAERFDTLLEEKTVDKNETIDVSKMLAEDKEVNGRPCRARTCDTLIKRYRPNVPPSAAE